MAEESKDGDYQKIIENNNQEWSSFDIDKDGHNNMLNRLDIDLITAVTEIYQNLKGTILKVGLKNNCLYIYIVLMIFGINMI